MKYNPEIHKRKSIRMKGYNYSRSGLYFITICVQNRLCLFGNVSNGKMVLNDAGNMVVKWYNELQNKFPDIKCHEMIVMPNHFHCIVENVGADQRVCPYTDGHSVHTDLHVCPDDNNTNPILGERVNFKMGEHVNFKMGEHVGSPLHRVVQWFKTITTNEYIRGVKNLGWKPFDGKLWQRNYFEHIIRNKQSYQNISNYIMNNPAKWQEDKF